MGATTVLRRQGDEACEDILATRRRIESKVESLRGRFTTEALTQPLRSRLKRTVGDSGEKMIEAFKENPVPMVLTGLGLGWMLLRDLPAFRNARLSAAPPHPPEPEDHPIADAAEGAVDKTKAAVQKVSDTMKSAAAGVRDASGKARDRARQAKDWIDRSLEDNPMMLAMGALAVGLVVGLALPVSEKEEEIAGKVGEKAAEAILEEGKAQLEKGETAPANAQNPAASENLG